MPVSKHQVMKVLESMAFSYDKTNINKKISLKTVLSSGYNHNCMGPAESSIDQLADHIVKELNDGSGT